MGEDLKIRTKRFAVDCWKFCTGISVSGHGEIWVRQLIKCSASVGANYRAARRAKSTADFINKLKIVEEETDESIYWVELIGEVLGPSNKEIRVLIKEGNELLAIIVTSIKTARNNRLNQY